MPLIGNVVLWTNTSGLSVTNQNAVVSGYVLFERTDHCSISNIANSQISNLAFDFMIKKWKWPSYILA